MTNLTINKNIPELRFPEFEGEWVKNEFSKKVERRKDKYNPENDYENYPCIELESLSQETGQLLNTFNSSKLKSIKNKFQSGDILFGKLRPYLKKYYKASFSGVCSSEIWVLKGKQTVNDFVYYLIQNEKFNYEVNLTTGSKMPRAEWNYISGVKFHFPNIPEQQKIATFLTAVDKRIHLLTQKKEKLEHYKKGVMQQLFSRELRFKDENENDYPEWEEKKLGEVFDFLGTNSLSRSMMNYENGIIKNIHYGDIHTKFKSLFDVSKEDVPFISNDVDTSKFLNIHYCKEGDLVLADASEDYKDIGKSIEIINTDNQPLVSGLHTILARPKRKSPLGFNTYLMQSSSVRKQLMSFASGISVLGISKNNLSLVTLQFPCFEEQQKIASFLSVIDKQIEQVAWQIEHSNQWKKGLLQKMFV
jgi:type I restriction enzyme S subunit